MLAIISISISQVECNANLANSRDDRNKTNSDLDDGHENDDDDDVDDGSESAARKCDADNRAKSISNRIAKRNYRRRSDSQSSTNSVPMPPMPSMPEQSNENSMNSSRNNREVNENKMFFFRKQLLLLLYCDIELSAYGVSLLCVCSQDTPESPPFVSLLDDDSTFSSDQNDSSDDDESSASESDNSTENEEKAQLLLNKPTPKYEPVTHNLI